MPELPEVETVRRALAPVMTGRQFTHVKCNRPDLRFPLPQNFADRLIGVRVEHLDRRGKYLLIHLANAETLIAHLGMSGRFLIEHSGTAQFHQEMPRKPAHDHIIFSMGEFGNEGGKARKRPTSTPHKPPEIGPAIITFNDPRRFGFMDLVETSGLDESRHFRSMGPEPLGNRFSAAHLVDALRGRRGPVKTALLDQRVVAGLGNIYVCEALFRAGISPKRAAGRISETRLVGLYGHILDVLREAIEAGGSSLRDFTASDGALGYFQHTFQVYDREGEKCINCKGQIRRIVQSGRSSFYCPICQR